MKLLPLLIFCWLPFAMGAEDAASQKAPGESKGTAAEQKPAGSKQAGGALKEEDLLGLYLQASTGALMQFEKGGKLSGWPVGGTYKITGKDRLELSSGEKGKEETLSLSVVRARGGLVLTRTVNGEEEPLPLYKLEPVKPDTKSWQGDCAIRALVAGEKTATNREVRLDADGRFMTREGGHYLRLFEKEGKTMAYVSGLDEETKLVSLYKAGPVVVLFDRLPSPTLLAIIQLKQTK